MAADVETAFWRDWQPGERAVWFDKLANPPKGGPYTREMVEERAAWEKWERRNHDVIRLTLIFLARNSTVMNSEEALTFMKVSTLSAAVDRKLRQMQYILRRLEEAQEIKHTECDGACGFSHGQSHHWIIPRPKTTALADWGTDRPPRKRGRPRKRGTL